MNVFAERKQRLHKLIEEFGGIAPLADRLGKDRTQVSQWNTGHRNISEASARLIEQKLRRPRGWMDGPAATVTAALQMQEPGPSAPYNWPFRIDYNRLLRVGAKERKQLDDFMEYVVTRWEESHGESGATGTA